MENFKPIAKTSVSSAIVTQILDMVESGKLAPGDRIPAEQQLCKMFCVGRGSVREGIKILETMGVLERQGKFVVVRNTTGFNPIAFSNMTKAVENINHVIEVRNIIEVDACRLAAMRATPEEIQALWAITQQPVSDVASFSTHDQSFHRAIIEASHNPVLLQIYDLICDRLFQTADVYLSAEDSAEKQRSIIDSSLRSHRELVHSIEAKDYKKAIIEMKNHLTSAGNTLVQFIRSSSGSSADDEQ